MIDFNRLSPDARAYFDALDPDRASPLLDEFAAMFRKLIDLGSTPAEVRRLSVSTAEILLAGDGFDHSDPFHKNAVAFMGEIADQLVGSDPDPVVQEANQAA